MYDSFQGIGGLLHISFESHILAALDNVVDIVTRLWAVESLVRARDLYL
jgi:hypothetical protein